MRYYCGLSSCLLLFLLRFILLLLPSGRGPLAGMGMGIEHNASTLTVDRLDYILFAGDITVNYTLEDAISPDDVEIQLINHADGNQIASFPLPSNTSEGQLIVSCGTVTSGGKIFFALSTKDFNLIVTVSETVDARWPPMKIRTNTGSHSFAALTDNIAVDVIVDDWEQLLCPWNDSSTDYSVSLDYYGSSDWRSSPEAVGPRSSQVISVSKLFDRREHSFTFQCQVVDQAGDYLVVLRSPKSLTIAVSQFIEVHWNPGTYELRTTLAAIFPCSDDVIVNFLRPRCAANDDKIRLYRQLRQENVTLASSSILSYVAERRPGKSSNHVAFACSEFEEELAPSYCWKYVTTARSGAIYEHKILCLPATTMDRPTNGDWSSWSEWSSCSATCLSGTQVRFRSCDNPPPANGGSYCDGQMTESRHCDVFCPGPSSSTTISYNFLSTNTSCDCGCRLTEPEGTVVAVSGCPSVVQWVIAVKDGLTIRLTFPVFDLETGGHANVRVRDGETTMSNLLLNSYDSGTPPDVVSAGSVLTIEFRTPVNYSGGGFVAKYSAQVRNMSVANASPQPGSTSETPVWKSAMIIVGVALGAVVITIAIVVVCCDVAANRTKRCKRRPNTKGHTVAFDKVPTTRELDYEEVASGVRVEVPGELEVARIYPRTGSDDITPSKFLATSSPYLDAGREDHSSGKRQMKARATTSERDPTTAPLVLPPVDLHQVESLPHNSKTGTHQRRSRKDEGGARHKRQSKSRDRKPPPPSSTFEEDFLMLARQNEVTGGGMAVTVDEGIVAGAGLVPWRTGVFPDDSRVRSSSSRRRRTKHEVTENIPLQSVDVNCRTRKHRTHHSSSHPRATDGVTGRGHGVVVGKRPPVEGSNNTVPDSSFRTSEDVTLERKEKGHGRTLKDGSTFKDGSAVVMTAVVDCNFRITDSDKLRRKMDHNSSSATPDYGSHDRAKTASGFRNAHANSTKESPDPGPSTTESPLRSDPGPDGQSQRGTFRSTSNSLNCSNSPSFWMSTERPPTHNSFQSGRVANLYLHIPKVGCHGSPRNTPQMSPARGPVRPPFPVVNPSLPVDSLVLNQADHHLNEEPIDKIDPQDETTISASL